MARFAFLLCYPLIVTACAEHNAYTFSPAGTEFSEGILGKTKNEVAQIVLPLKQGLIFSNQDCIADWKLSISDVKKEQVFYFDEDSILKLQVSFADGHATKVEMPSR
jgi:hypothetical protein